MVVLSIIGLLFLALFLFGICMLYDKDYYSQSPGTDPQGPASEQQRVKRGGSWYDISSTTLSSSREEGRPGELLDSNGFRVVAVP
jgi:sulfatase modifying factor 1